MKLTGDELYKIKGGAKGGFTVTGGLILGALFTLIAGIIDGYLNPNRCNG